MTTGWQAEEPETLDACADTVRVRVLPESDLNECADSEAPVPGFDPYSSGIPAPSARPKSRRTLDDMRRLSEAIVRGRLGPK